MIQSGWNWWVWCDHWVWSSMNSWVWSGGINGCDPVLVEAKDVIWRGAAGLGLMSSEWKHWMS